MSSAQDPIASAEDAQRLLGSLAGVVSAHVVADATGDIVEIHILSSADLHPKQIVRNVESALSAGLGLTVDRRIVSVAQIRADVEANGHGRGQTLRTAHEELWEAMEEAGEGREPPTRAAPDASGPRLEFVRFQSRRDAERCVCDVVLRAGDDEVAGSGFGPDTAAGRAEAAARAVFDGIGAVRPELRLDLEAAVISTSRGRDFVIVAARAVLDRDAIRLAGAAPLARSPEEAAILAALQATNRWSA